METRIRMISAVSEILTLKNKNPALSNERLLQHISERAMAERSERIKLGMIAAASKAIDYKERNPSSSEKEIIKYVMNELNSIISRVGD